MSKATEEDKLLFEQAIQGVKPIKNQKKHEYLSPKPKAKTQREIQKKLQNQHEAANYQPTEAVNAHQSLVYQVKGLRIQDLARLRKGDFTLQGRLDLHGYTEETAEYRLTQFVHQGYLKKQRYLLVVHGKGYNSDIDYPVLKNLVNRMLRSMPEVVAFCSATQKDGGAGAVYILLKAQSERGF